jgi:hypothetical protein
MLPEIINTEVESKYMEGHHEQSNALGTRLYANLAILKAIHMLDLLCLIYRIRPGPVQPLLDG